MYLHSWSAVRHGNSTSYILPYDIHSRDVTTFFRIQVKPTNQSLLSFPLSLSHHIQVWVFSSLSSSSTSWPLSKSTTHLLVLSNNADDARCLSNASLHVIKPSRVFSISPRAHTLKREDHPMCDHGNTHLCYLLKGSDGVNHCTNNHLYWGPSHPIRPIIPSKYCFLDVIVAGNNVCRQLSSST